LLRRNPFRFEWAESVSFCSSHGCGVDSVVLLVGPNELDESNLTPIAHVSDKPVFVAADIEDHSDSISDP
jgi:hypothetical protein